MGLLSAHCAFAGLVMNTSTRTGSKVTDRARISVASGVIFMEVETSKPGVYQPAMLYRASNKELLLFDPDKRQYMAMNAEQLQGLVKQMRGMLEMLPPEMRQMAGPMAGSLPRIEIQALGKTAKIGERKCAGYRILQDGKPTTEIWTTSLSDIGATEAEIQTYKSFVKMASEMAAAMPSSMTSSDAAFLGMERIEGAPVQIRKLEAPEEITDVTFQKQDLDSRQFQPPAGYTRTAFPIPGMGL